MKRRGENSWKSCQRCYRLSEPPRKELLMSLHSLMFGTKAVIPTEAGLQTLTTLVVEDIEGNQRKLARNLDLLEWRFRSVHKLEE